MAEPRAPYWIRRITDGRIIAEAANYEAAREAMWLAWQRGWMVEVQPNPLDTAWEKEGDKVEALNAIIEWGTKPIGARGVFWVLVGYVVFMFFLVWLMHLDLSSRDRDKEGNDG